MNDNNENTLFIQHKVQQSSNDWQYKRWLGSLFQANANTHGWVDQWLCSRCFKHYLSFVRRMWTLAIDFKQQTIKIQTVKPNPWHTFRWNKSLNHWPVPDFRYATYWLIVIVVPGTTNYDVCDFSYRRGHGKTSTKQNYDFLAWAQLHWIRCLRSQLNECKTVGCSRPIAINKIACGSASPICSHASSNAWRS